MRALLLLAIASMFPMTAQTMLRSSVFYTVKPDRVDDFLSATKDYAALLKKAGSAQNYTVWQSLTGPREYVAVRYYTKWAELDMAPRDEPKLQAVQKDLIPIVNRIMDCVESMRRVVSERQTDLSLPQGTEVPELAYVLRWTVKADQMENFKQLVKAELLPAAKKGGLKTYLVDQTRLGESAMTMTAVAGYSSWGDLDGGGAIQKALGAGYPKLLERVRPMLQDAQYEMYRLMRDQSYMAASSR